MPRVIKGQPYLTVAEAAKEAGIHKITLLRWIKAGKVSDGCRDRHGWRLFSPEQVSEIKDFAFLTEPAAGAPEEQLSLFSPAPAGHKPALIERRHETPETVIR